MNWKYPKTPEEATEAIDELDRIVSNPNNFTEEIHQNSVRQLAKYGACFNHNFTRAHRDTIMDILVANAEVALEPVLEALADCPRAEQIDFTSLFIRKAFTIKGNIQ